MPENQLTATKASAEVAAPESTRGGTYYTPRVDIYESADEVVVMCDLPGVKPQDLNVQFAKGELSLCGPVPPRQMPAEYSRQENGIGDFYRSFTNSPEIDANKISAENREGVLTVRLPKPEKAKPKKLTVKAG
jgi:HSP20 family protein